MTDDEIITALECCCNLERIGCEECPQYELHSAMCIKDVMNKALGLINCQKAEIERLKQENSERTYEGTIEKSELLEWWEQYKRERGYL